MIKTYIGQDTLGWINADISAERRISHMIYTHLDAGTHQLNHTIACPPKKGNTASHYPKSFFVEVIDTANKTQILTSERALHHNIIGYTPTDPAQ